ncbi:hypothetical protein Tco_0704345 [Tanacetum coccineum]|uniref:Uncharacterized protein n=1 Tax=Tanacetum coccineum TaxID=301880 RepID=A0ABQ4Y1G6_9ASTR
METIHVTFDELTEQTAPVLSSLGPALNLLTPGPISSGLVPNPPPTAPYVPHTNKELEILFQPMFDEYFMSSTVDRLVPPAPAAQALVNPTGLPVSIPIDQEAPSGSHSPSSLDYQSSSVHQGVAAEHLFELNPFAAIDPEPFVAAEHLVLEIIRILWTLRLSIVPCNMSNPITIITLNRFSLTYIGIPSSILCAPIACSTISPSKIPLILSPLKQFSNGPMSNRKTFKFDVTRRLLVFSSHARMNPIEFNRLDVMGTVPLQLCNDYCSQVDL